MSHTENIQIKHSVLRQKKVSTKRGHISENMQAHTIKRNCFQTDINEYIIQHFKPLLSQFTSQPKPPQPRNFKYLITLKSNIFFSDYPTLHLQLRTLIKNLRWQRPPFSTKTKRKHPGTAILGFQTNIWER